MKNVIKLFSIAILGILVTSTFISCSNDDDDTSTVYSYTLETYTDLTTSNNTEDATNAVELFVSKNWMTTKTFSGASVEVNDVQAKVLFESIVEQANQEFSIMTFHGNAKLTYKCTRDGESVEIGVQEWNYLD